MSSGIPIIDGASTNGNFEFGFNEGSDYNELNLFFAAGTPTATIELQSRNDLAFEAGETDPWVTINSWTQSTSVIIDEITSGTYRLVVSGGPSGNLYATLSTK